MTAEGGKGSGNKDVSVADDYFFAVDGADSGEINPFLLNIDRQDGNGSDQHVADENRATKLQVLASIDTPRPWQTSPEKTREKTRPEKTMSDPLPEARLAGVFVV